MKTEVVMERELFGYPIRQKSKSEMFSATDLVRAGNSWRIKNGISPFDMGSWFQQKNVSEFIKELENQYGVVKISARGRGHHTWVHPFLFIDMALAINPKLKIEVYSWLYDHLLRYRNKSGDSYKKMSGAVYIAITNKSEFPKKIQQIAKEIQIAVDSSDWQTCDEEKLKKRDRIHENIALLCDVLPVDDAVRIGIKKGLDEK
jgi:hypothetical protein